MSGGHIAVIDIGKTNAKLALVRRADLAEIDVETTPNTVLPGPPYPHFDTDALWAFILGGLRKLHARAPISAICVTTHGASGALIGRGGALAAPILDYEHTGPDARAETYDALRPEFAQTGAPRLPMGLNLGAQIHWLLERDPGLLARTKSIVTYPQYWGYRLTGALACDVTSLGCHTDLWDPFAGRFSGLATRLGIAGKLAPPRRPAEVLGHLRPQIAAETGLPEALCVHCGIHDSNASLLPHVMRRDPPFSVISTGTWVIAMTIGGADAPLDPARDTLVNVNALGAPVPSARFMGGREYEIIRAGQSPHVGENDLTAAAQSKVMLMPSVAGGSGPFPGRAHVWTGEAPAPGTPARSAALSFYLALMSAECLSLTGHLGPIIVEGPFAANAGYCAMLAAATGCAVHASSAATGTAGGAALLALDPTERTEPGAQDESQRYAPESHPAFARYAKVWQSAARAR